MENTKVIESVVFSGAAAHLFVLRARLAAQCIARGAPASVAPVARVPTVPKLA